MNGLYDEIRIAIHAVWQRRWLALAVAWGIAILGWLVVSQLPNRYEAKARVFVQMSSALPAAIGMTAADQQNDVDTIRQTLTSAVNLEKVVRGTDLANTVSGPQDIADRVAGLQTSIKIVAQQNNLFEITASAGSPKLAKQIVDKLISIFVDQNLSDGRTDTQTTLRFLDDQVAQLQTRLADADAKRTQFQTQYLGSLPGTGTLQDRMGAARTQMAQIDSDLAGAQTSLAAINGQMAGAQPTVAGPSGVVGGPARARLAAIEGQLADARAKGYTENHPDVIALKSQLAAARAAANSEPLGAGGGGQPNPIYLSLKSMQADKQAQVAALVARKSQLQGDINSIIAKLNGDPAVASEQGQIERDYQVLKDKYDALLGQRETIRVRAQAQAQTDAIKFRTIDPPVAPRKPTAPNRPLLLTGVLIMAIGGGIAAAFAMAQLKATFATAGRLEKATGLPVIGSVSERVSHAEQALRARKFKLFAGASAGLAVAFVGLLAVEMLMRGARGMNKPIINRGGSLLERAAEVYDFSAHFRAPAIPADDMPPALPVEAVAPLRMSPQPIASVTPITHRQAEIDRALLTENGLLVPGAPVGVLAEEFRLAKRQLLLTARRLAATDPAKARTMLICSPKPGDGKTYCAVNLAISMAAERDLRVLLVDADFAKPNVMKRLGVEDGPGLLDALGDPSIDVESCVVGTDIPNLSLLPAGAGSTSDTELIASDRTPALIARLLAADPQRVVIFDSPPALAASPASVLALHVGQVALVIRADRTVESDIRDAVHRLAGCEEIQLLLNSVSFAPGGARFGSYYGQGDVSQ